MRRLCLIVLLLIAGFGLVGCHQAYNRNQSRTARTSNGEGQLVDLNHATNPS
ncbi:MAG TPA: hypothetical protein VJT71_19360 [Pyrinomonadaceae bacterium]|nr:hypothetical protein [Pyrinomonadaceae bacterium]